MPPQLPQTTKPQKCCVRGCTSTNQNYRLYSLPRTDKLRELWLSFLVPSSPFLATLSKQSLILRRVCERHFEKSQLRADGKRNHFPPSYPTLFTESEIMRGIPLQKELAPSASSEGATNVEEHLCTSLYEDRSSSEIQEEASIINYEGDKENNTNTLHEGLNCDICKGPIQGFRYKCVQCADFDLCAKCEANSEHPLHFMLRIPRPMTYATVQRVLGPLQNLFVPTKEEPKEFDVTLIEGSFKESPKCFEYEIDMEFTNKSSESSAVKDPLELTPVQAMRQVKRKTANNENCKKTTSKMQVSKRDAKTCTNEKSTKENSLNREKCFENVNREYSESSPYKIESESNKRRRISEDNSDTDKRNLVDSDMYAKKEYTDRDLLDDELE